MPEDHQLTDLLVQWEADWKQGIDVPPEELCKNCPELVDQLVEQIQKLKDINGWIEPMLRAESHLATQEEHANQLVEGFEPGHGYRLIERLGSGGFGEVWKAAGPGKFQHALKFVDLRRHAGSLELEALQIIREGVGHAHLLHIHGYWFISGRSETVDPSLADWLVIAMELAECTLWDRFREMAKKGFPGIVGSELMGYMADAADALDYLANKTIKLQGKPARRLQHGDVKPQNLLLLGGSAKVADFGLLHLLQHSITDYAGGLTPIYASPETFEGETSRWSDQYSLAITYCVLRSGKAPFSGNLQELRQCHLKRLPDLTILPEADRSSVAKALAKNPRDRWQSCREFVQALAWNQGRTTIVASVLPHLPSPVSRPLDKRISDCCARLADILRDLKEPGNTPLEFGPGAALKYDDSFFTQFGMGPERVLGINAESAIADVCRSIYEYHLRWGFCDLSDNDPNARRGEERRRAPVSNATLIPIRATENDNLRSLVDWSALYSSMTVFVLPHALDTLVVSYSMSHVPRVSDDIIRILRFNKLIETGVRSGRTLFLPRIYRFSETSSSSHSVTTYEAPFRQSADDIRYLPINVLRSLQGRDLVADLPIYAAIGVPYFRGASLSEIIKIAESETDAFLKFNHFLNTTLGAAGTANTEEQVRRCFEEIEYELANLRIAADRVARLRTLGNAELATQTIRVSAIHLGNRSMGHDIAGVSAVPELAIQLRNMVASEHAEVELKQSDVYFAYLLQGAGDHKYSRPGSARCGTEESGCSIFSPNNC